MNIRSRSDEEEEAETDQKKKYLPIGYGGPNTGERGGFPVDGRYGQEGGMFDIFFEFLGIKRGSRKHSTCDAENHEK